MIKWKASYNVPQCSACFVTCSYKGRLQFVLIQFLYGYLLHNFYQNIMVDIPMRLTNFDRGYPFMLFFQLSSGLIGGKFDIYWFVKVEKFVWNFRVCVLEVLIICQWSQQHQFRHTFPMFIGKNICTFSPSRIQTPFKIDQEQLQQKSWRHCKCTTVQVQWDLSFVHFFLCTSAFKQK